MLHCSLRCNSHLSLRETRPKRIWLAPRAPRSRSKSVSQFVNPDTVPARASTRLRDPAPIEGTRKEIGRNGFRIIKGSLVRSAVPTHKITVHLVRYRLSPEISESVDGCRRR